MIFELGKYYKHTDGGRLHIIALAQTRMYGLSLLAELRCNGNILAVGMSESNAVNYREISKEESERIENEKD